MIQINEKLCNSCNACVAVCPSYLINIGNPVPDMPSENEAKCIHCGHCEAVCPEKALAHSFPEKATSANFTEKVELSKEQVGSYFRNRRSIRRYKSKTLGKDEILEIMDIVRFAPSGTNKQPITWSITKDSNKVKEITETTIQWMRTTLASDSPLKNVIPFEKLIFAHEKGFDILCRNAPHLIIASTPKEHSIGAVDAVIALTQFELALPAFGLGACWAGYLMAALRFSPEVAKIAGVPENFTAQGALMFGYPVYKYQKLPKRNQAEINWI